MTGRPSSYTEELASKILAKLPYADGGLEEVCKEDGFPSDRTVYRWLADPAREDFRQAYAHAREMCGEVQAARALRDALSAEDAAKGRLAFDARKWMASKLAPKKYGDKVTTEVTGANGGPVDVTDSQAAARLAAILAAAQARRDSEG